MLNGHAGDSAELAHARPSRSPVRWRRSRRRGACAQHARRRHRGPRRARRGDRAAAPLARHRAGARRRWTTCTAPTSISPTCSTRPDGWRRRSGWRSKGRVERERTGMGRGYASFLLAEAANRCIRLGRLAEADDLTRRALDYGPGGISAGLAHRGARRVLHVLGRATRREPTWSRPSGCCGATTSMWIAPLYARLAELAELDGSIDQVRRCTAEGRRLMAPGEEYAFYVRELYMTDFASRADAAQRARARATRKPRGCSPLGRGDGGRFARRGCHGRCPRKRAAPGAGRPRRRGGGGIAPRRAGPTRAVARTRRRPTRRIGNRIAAAYSRMREAEAIIESGGDRDEARRPCARLTRLRRLRRRAAARGLRRARPARPHRPGRRIRAGGGRRLETPSA